VTNYQSQLLEKFRLTWVDLRAANDRLIFVHITGYSGSSFGNPFRQSIDAVFQRSDHAAHRGPIVVSCDNFDFVLRAKTLDE